MWTKKFTKKITATCLGIGIALGGFSGFASASENSLVGKEKIEQSSIEKQNVNEEINSVFSKIRDLRAQGATDEDIEKYLKKNGIDVVEKKSWRVDKDGNRIELSDDDINIQNLYKSDRLLNEWVTRHDRQYNYFIVYAEIRASTDWPYPYTIEPYPGTDDLVSIHWDPEVLRFSTWGVSESNQDDMGLANTAGMYDGAMVYYLDDNVFDYDNNGYAAAWATLEALKTGVTTTVGMDFVHTYNVENVTTNLTNTAEINFSGSEYGASVGASYSVETSTSETDWGTADTAQFTTNW